MVRGRRGCRGRTPATHGVPGWGWLLRWVTIRAAWGAVDDREAVLARDIAVAAAVAVAAVVAVVGVPSERRQPAGPGTAPCRPGPVSC